MTMSRRVISQRRDPYELLERMLNETCLTTKRVQHNHIIDVGDILMKQSNVDLDGIKQSAVDQALKEAEKRHSRELRAALKRLEKNLIQDKDHALDRQKRYYELLAKRVAEQRDNAEEERIRELRKQWEAEKQSALQAQWEECERLKAQAVLEACQALEKKLRNEFALQKEIAVAEALNKAREQFKVREQESIDRTRRECEVEFAQQLALVREEHVQQIRQQQKRYSILEQKYFREVEHKKMVEKDFKGLQDDYRRFMNYTDGQYHSDYMMHLRSHGLHLAQKTLGIVKYEEIEPII